MTTLITPPDRTSAMRRWRLLLGPDVDQNMTDYGCSLSAEDGVLDQALAALYDETGQKGFTYTDNSGQAQGSTQGGRGRGTPHVARWLGDIRKYFQDDLVSVIQADAIERKGLTQLLLEPETLRSVKPDLGIVQTLMALRGKIPEAAKDAARTVVRAVVEDINKRLANDLRRAVSGALNKKAHSPIPSAASVDWKTTIRRNIKNYHPELGTLIPERFFFFDRSQRRNKWTVILDMDQSGSMADSIVYGSIAGSIFSSMASLKTHVIAFDDEVVDLTEKYGTDPVDMIFGVQLGGGTNIEKSLAYCEQFITDPAHTLFILLSDLGEGGNLAKMYARMQNMKDSGVKVVCLLALADSGSPYYDTRIATRIAAMGIPSFACTPNQLPPLIEGVLKGRDLSLLAKELSTTK